MAKPTKENLLNRVYELEGALEDASDALAEGNSFEAEEIIDEALNDDGEDD